jgi:hypothetical protein
MSDRRGLLCRGERGRLGPDVGTAGDYGRMVPVMDGPACNYGGRAWLGQVISDRTLNLVAAHLAESGASGWLARRAAKQGGVLGGDLELAAEVSRCSERSETR